MADTATHAIGNQKAVAHITFIFLFWISERESQPLTLSSASDVNNWEYCDFQAAVVE